MWCRVLILIVLALANLLGCAPTDKSQSTTSVKPSPGPTPNVSEIDSPDVKIDAAMQNVASEFKHRLDYYNGKLLFLTFENGFIAASWSSQKCDWLKQEIIDLAISIHRGHTGVVDEIDINRICDSKVKRLRISGVKFNNYKSGQISDTQFLEGIE